MTIDPREDRLPKWAQQELATLRSTAERYRAALDNEPASLSRITLRGVDRPIDPDAQVTWNLGAEGDQDEITIHPVEQRRSDGERGSLTVLRVMARHGRIVVSPGGGINTVTIRGEDW